MELASMDNYFDGIALKFAQHVDTKIVKFLGSGEHGNAYLTDNDRVIKVTTDKSEYDESRRLIGKDPIHLPKIYDCYTVESKNLITPMWVIYLEYVRHNRKEQEHLWWELVNAFEDDLHLDFMDELSSYQVNHNSTDEMVDLLNHLNIGEDVVDYYGQIINMIDEMKKYGIKSIDYGPNNFGFRNNTLVFFDLGFGEEDENGSHKTFKF